MKVESHLNRVTREGDGPRNLPQAFSVGADLSTEEVRASDAGESGRGK